ncbi:alkaline phosphatase family protein [Trinickia acidisoli]|uniref:alkaline phosphatase family protein n=1 Tax=Trinickia acidisoli TaxID=2767482 RepID=UPI001A8DEFE7|nr:nucleotide pyrophosphatase/phosphodiesterase family protein [Trinickia acidisoli]
MAAPVQAALPAGAPVHHVLLISVDGLHGSDLAHFASAHPDSTLAKLRDEGVAYTNAHTVVPADSFPGLMALVTGGTPAVTGVYYDDSYDRSLAAPGSDCSKLGTRVRYDESVDTGKQNVIDASKMPRDPKNGCVPLFPHAYLRVNTIFDAVRDAGGYTAWIDKHPTYEIVQGPSGHGVDDLFLPEIGANYEGMNNVSTTEITGSLAKTERYDAMKARAILNQIDGRTHDGSKDAPVPNVFGMNFQSVNVGEKLHGWRDADGNLTPGLDAAIGFVDRLLGGFVQELDKKGLRDDTLIVITAKHGNGPIDRALLHKIDSDKLEQAVRDAAPGALAQITVDHGALIWLKDPSATAKIAAALRAHAKELGIRDVLHGTRLARLFPSPTKDSRTPDLVVVTRDGVIYTSPNDGKLAEHGGFHDDDTSVALILSSPRLAGGRRVRYPVSTTEVAPTVVSALGLSPDTLQAVVREGAGILPGVNWTSPHALAQNEAGGTRVGP